ncbi:MAG: ABC transporter ATP-binding protein [Acidimicrobiales bacterium]|nr:ABC transporter ATP-binding protein [Acidimicrobiales bacterium]
MSAVLELDDVHAGYGPFRALFGVNLSVAPGEAVAVVGSNGVGKTTLARVASGLVRPTSGRVVVDGNDFTRARTFQFARAGVAHAPEGRSTFASLTVEENLELSIRRVRGNSGVRAGLDEAYEMFPALAERRQQLAGTLSGGQQRMLAMVRVLVDAPKLLVADELSLGLAPLIVEQVYEMLGRVRETGTALLVIEQHVSHALKLCDRVVLLDRGSVAWAGPASEAGEHVQSQLGVPAH